MKDARKSVWGGNNRSNNMIAKSQPTNRIKGQRENNKRVKETKEGDVNV